MSSSHRQSAPCEASLFRDEKALGPLRLPMKEKDAFVAQFNRLYHQSGMTASPHGDVAPGILSTEDVPDAQDSRDDDANG